jgi:hypothetical protein
MDDSWSVKNLIDFVVESTQRGRADDVPFHHLRLDRVFPDNFYAAMLATNDYRAMSGKTKMGSGRPEADAHQDRFISRVHSALPTRKACNLKRGEPRSSFERTGNGLHGAARART